MKKTYSLLALLASLNMTLYAQEDVSEIFDDLTDLQPAPMPAAPAVTMPRSKPSATQSISTPNREQTVLYSAASGGGTPTPVEPLKVESSPVDVEEGLAKGKEAYGDDDWDQAQGFFEAVLAEDPYNKSAMRWLRRIASKKTGREEKSYGTTRVRMLENVQAAWNTPKAEGTSPNDPAVRDARSESELQADKLIAQLQAIRIPSIAFQNAGIQQVVAELSAMFRELDSDGKGVNLAVFGASETLLPPVTFSGTDLSALETLDIITQMSGTKYEIGPNLVALTPVNYESPQQMETEEFDVVPSVGSKMVTLSSGGSLSAGAGLMDVRDFFSNVPFPTGSSAQYNPEFNILLVKNSPKHISKINALLKRYNQKALDERSQQVEIETKFIEVAEGSLDELGFEWTIGDGGYLNNDTIAIPGGQKLFTDKLRTGIEAFGSSVKPAGRASSFNSYAGAVANPIADGLIDTAGELLVQKIKGDIPVEVIIKALERQAGSDLLSAPKILTKSGETATIHVGEIHRFPSAYELEIEREAQPVMTPLDYEEQKTGVMLEVTPELDPENGTIDMKLMPEIRELIGFDEQHVATLWPFFNSGSTSANAFDIVPKNIDANDLQDLLGTSQGAADRLIARMPIFKSRKMETSVTIQDGSTIAMGGLIKEELETFKDSVPILGRIPLVGRLFRSEGERSVKRNLIIFVTANQVDASGHKKDDR